MKDPKSKNASFLLPMQFDPLALKEDLERCKKYNFLQNYIPKNYNGKNYILPLRSIDGRMDLPFAVQDQQNRFQDSPALENCNYFKKVIASFLCDKEAIRLMSLPPGKHINTHTDHNCGYEDGVFRLHIPILTNEDVYFILNDQRINMNAGETWYTNVNLPHSVSNKGETDRVHLVIDGIRNEWSDHLFKSMGYNFDLENEDSSEDLSEYSDEVIKRMIEELKLQNTPQSDLLIQGLKKKIKP